MQPHRKITLIQKAINAILLFTILFGIPSIGITGTGTLNDYNPYNVDIQDNNDGEADSSDLLLSGAPAGSVITKVKVYFEIRHTWPEDLEVWLTTYYDGSWHDYQIYNQGDLGGTPDVVKTIDNITKWNGASPNQTWYLSVRDRIAQDIGYIDFFELWVDYTTVEEPVIDATITIQPLAAVIQGNTLSVDCDVRNDGNDTHSFGIGAEIDDGSTVLAELGQQTASSVSPGSTKTVTFTYTIPAGWEAKDYSLHAVVWSGTPGSSDWLYDHNRTFSVIAQDIDASIAIDPIAAVQAGNSVSIPCEVTNDGNVSHAFGIGAEIWKGGVKQDDVGSQTTASIAPGHSTVDSFSYEIPSSWTVTYTARCAVWSGTPGSSTWLNSYDRNFTVNPNPLLLNGRITYHSYSKYLAVPAGGDTVDGHIFIYDPRVDSLTNVTLALPVVNSMNAHFSPDGAKLVFMAVPASKASDTAYDSEAGYWHRRWSNLDVFSFDLASGTLSNLTPNAGTADEDPKFSPDGQYIVWKRNGQIWRMNTDGTNPTQLTSGGLEKSGPNYSPDGSHIVYWVGTRADDNEDIWRISADGSSETLLVANASIHDYYPIYRDAENILYARAESANSDFDKVYNYNTTSGSSPLLLNQAGANDSDASPINSTYVTFCSTREGNGYDVFVGRYDNDAVYALPAANSSHEDLGPSYSPYSYARGLIIQSPTQGQTYITGTTALLSVRLMSDGSVWSGASPSVILTGPTTIQYTGLRDDGTQGDVTSGDGIYSRSVMLPSTEGSYTVSATSLSVEPGVTRQVESNPISIDINIFNSAPTDIALSSESLAENEPSGTTVGTFSTTDPDTNNTFTYTLRSGNGDTDNGAFTITDNQLKTAASFDYETKNNYSIRVRTTDQGDLWLEKVFIIQVEDIPEILKGDINNDRNINLEDAIIVLQLLAGLQSTQTINLLADVNGDGKIGLEEALYILRNTME
jgi:subtilisin-like proprotein convertase family protein